MAIDLEIDGHIALITINRPERLNAMDADAYKALSEAWCRVRDDVSIHCAVVTGAGDKSFTVGADLKTFITSPTDLSEFWLTQRDLLLNRGLEVWKPVIAAVNGYCLGGGMTLLLATDIRIAAPHATFGLSEVKRGILAGNGGTQRILEQLPYARAMELLLTGDPIDARLALEWGLINRVVEPSELLEAAMGFARRIAANAPLAVQATKESAVRSRELGLVAGLRFEQILNRILLFSEDAQEGPAAFAAKREARYAGR